MIAAMQIIGAEYSPKSHLTTHIVGAAAGTILVVSGLTLAFATLLTPYLDLIALGRFGEPGAPGGLLARWLAIALAAVFLGVGAARLAELLADIRTEAGPIAPPTTRTSADEPVMAMSVDIGDGRPIPKLVIGRFGVAVIRDLPPTSVARHQGPYWEGRTDQGWIRIEGPLDRASRDAERVRRWLAHDDRDYVVRVYAAVVGPDVGIPRTPMCAVLSNEQLEPWLASLPVQRSLNDARRQQLVTLLHRRANRS